ncbi:MAG TPA: hypothetical protein VME66_02345 [Candidatus Acidoferrales bacterium]|nr:hypothetical protein [Candidatus Acidoferrales bacterium]
MSKAKARIDVTDEQIEAAIALAKLREPYRPKAVAATYRAKDDVIAIQLATGVEVAIPRKLLQGLGHATPEQVGEVEIWDRVRACTGSRSMSTTTSPALSKASS